METDHSEFIAKHHRIVQKEKEPEKATGRTVALAVVIIFLYFIVCVVVAVVMNIQREAVIAAGGAFVAATFISYFIQKVFRIRSAREKELELIHEVLEGSRGARLITDGSDNVVYTNHRFLELCTDIGKPSLDTLTKLFTASEETASHFRVLADQAHRGLTDSIELHSDIGSRDAWYMVTAQPISGWSGYIHWRIDDITDKRAVDKAIREEREKLIDFTDNAPVGFFSVDEKGRFVFVNATLARWLGQDIQTLLAKGKLHTYFDKPPGDARPFDIVPNGGAKQMGEVVMKGHGGKTFIASINQAVVHEAGGVVRTRGVVHDLTAERAMRQALQASEDRFERFFEEAPLGIALLNAERKLDDCNPALGDILDLSINDLMGMDFEELVDEEDRAVVSAMISRLEKSEEMTAPQEAMLKGEKESVSVSLYGRRLEGSDNIVLHFIDLTDQKTLEEQYVQAQKMQGIGQLAGGVAHDFNNLLTAMIGFCDLLLLRHKAGDSSFSDIMQIKQNANRAANLVRQLLAFSRQQTLRPKVQDITDILTEVSHLLRRLIGANIELEVIHGSNLGMVKVDVGQMEQVLINLAVNARDAMDGGGRLTIETAHIETKKPEDKGGDEMPPGSWTIIKVIDTGCGIPAENITRIFEPFFTTKEVGQGTGLGLATVYGIIRQTDGFLDVKSVPDKGTTFEIYLPCLSEAEIEEGKSEEEEEEEDYSVGDLTGTAKILLVEDEDAVRTFSARALANKGYEVLDADSGEAALEIMSSQEDGGLDLLITDVIMPNMDGPTLAQRMRQINPKLKIIFISGYTEEKLKEHMSDNTWFLPKPFTLKQLAAKVKEALDD
jgi:two-component system cell cycle sensor histidine kinase/response regulator CckA